MRLIPFELPPRMPQPDQNLVFAQHNSLLCDIRDSLTTNPHNSRALPAIRHPVDNATRTYRRVLLIYITVYLFLSIR